MDVMYVLWEPDKGLEDIQAKIFSEASGLPERAEVIRERNLQRAPEMTRYALTKDRKPLAYVTARDSGSEPGRTYIGYPWTLPNCPEDVQLKIFDEMMSYLEAREETTSIGTTVIEASKLCDTQKEFFSKRGFVEGDHVFVYRLPMDVVETSKLKVSTKAGALKCKIASVDDLDAIVELSQQDEGLRSQMSIEAIKDYFTNRVLKEGPTVLLFDEDQIVAATAPLRFKPNNVRVMGDEDRIIMRFTAIRPGYNYVWSRLLVEMAKACKDVGWTDIKIQAESHFVAGSPAIIGLAELRPEIIDFETIMVKQE
ncbi:hypothetical protein EU528_13905 [Candidatus Thorarchaeota archaeon]|nr:MAG: hypothetical protein EU528_13905 [Candidatus Thorarchaeota archaeon]